MNRSTLKIEEIIIHPNNHLELIGSSKTNSKSDLLKAKIDYKQFNYLLGKSGRMRFELATAIAEKIHLNPGISQPINLPGDLNKTWIIPNCTWNCELEKNKNGKPRNWIKTILVAEK